MVSSGKKYFYNIENDVYWSIKYCKQICCLWYNYTRPMWFQVRLCTVLGWKLLSIFDFARVLFVAQRRTMIAGGVKKYVQSTNNYVRCLRLQTSRQATTLLQTVSNNSYTMCRLRNGPLLQKLRRKVVFVQLFQPLCF